MKAGKSTYADSGVDIDAGNALVERIKPFTRMTMRAGADAALGGFGGLFDLKQAGYKDPLLVAGTDGVGTKLKVAQEAGRHDSIGIDLVAMCVNDLVVQGAEPLFFLDYFACGKLETEVAAKVIEGIAKGCKEAGCALIGGETAEMPGMYKPGEYDLAGFAVGAVERDEVLPKSNINPGDIVIGLASSGLHSNGFSLVRHILAKSGAKDKVSTEILLIPTRIYVSSCLALARQGLVKAMAHITGGGLIENVPRVLPEGIGVELDAASWPVPEIFKWLAREGEVETQEMLRTFNCGIGMVIIVARQDADKAVSLLRDKGEQAFIIGKVIPRSGAEAVRLVHADTFFNA